MKTKCAFVFALLLVHNQVTVCRVNAITQRLETGYSCITHPCVMPGDQLQYVQEFSDVYIFQEGRILSEDGTWFVLGHVQVGETVPIPISSNVVFKEQEGTIAVLSTMWQMGWYHWLIELLPRLYILQQSGIEYDYIHLYSAAHAYMAGIQMQSLYAVLDYLGIPRNKVLLVGGDVCLHAKKVLRPSYPYLLITTPIFPLWMRDFLQDVFLSRDEEETTSYPLRIYVSRADARIRHIANEDTLAPLLERYGFKKVILSQYAAHEQASMFNHASIVIAQHGAA